MGFTTSGQVQSLSKKELTDKFGERTAEYIWNAVRGFHDEPGEIFTMKFIHLPAFLTQHNLLDSGGKT